MTTEASREDAVVAGICDEVRTRLALRRPESDRWTEREVRPVAVEAVRKLALEAETAERVVAAALSDLVGLGPLEALLADPHVREIMVNGPHAIFVETRGELVRHEARFRDAAHLEAVLERLLAGAGRSVHEARPHAEGLLPDGSRFHLAVPPLSRKGPVLTVRRFPTARFTLDDLSARLGSLAPPLAALLRLLVERRESILFTGGAGAGKTTLMNALASAAIPPTERVISLETVGELELDRENWVALECVGAGPAPIDLRGLLRNALRMRPDRLLVGEVLGIEAFDLLQVLNAGHSGCMTTLHAGSPREALDRLVALALSAGTGIEPESVRRQLLASLRVIVQMERSDGGARLVSRVELRDSAGEAIVAIVARPRDALEQGELVEPPRYEVVRGPRDFAGWPEPARARAEELLAELGRA